LLSPLTGIPRNKRRAYLQHTRDLIMTHVGVMVLHPTHLLLCSQRTQSLDLECSEGSLCLLYLKITAALLLQIGDRLIPDLSDQELSEGTDHIKRES
jgi:hypothetical protein